MIDDIRKHYRYPCMGVAEIKILRGNPDASSMTSLLHDLSPSGLKCKSFQPLPAGTPIEITIYEFMGMDIRVIIKGVVAWSLKNGMIGICFTKSLDQVTYPEL